MNDEVAIRQRITDFLTDALAWTERYAAAMTARAGNIEALEFAEQEKKALARDHGVDEETFDSLHLSLPPAHSPNKEIIEAIQLLNETTALVETCSRVQSTPEHFEYEVAKVHSEWRIKELRQIWGDKTMPPSDAGILDTLRHSPCAPLFTDEPP